MSDLLCKPKRTKTSSGLFPHYSWKNEMHTRKSMRPPLPPILQEKGNDGTVNRDLRLCIGWTTMTFQETNLLVTPSFQMML